LQLYEGIVETPLIALEIREILTEQSALFGNICDITIDGLNAKLEILVKNSTVGSRWNELYNEALTYINDHAKHDDHANHDDISDEDKMKEICYILYKENFIGFCINAKKQHMVVKQKPQNIKKSRKR
jgi:hypothetical protein